MQVQEGKVNLALWNGFRKEYYLPCLKRHANEGKYVAVGKRVSVDGRLLELCASFEFATESDACRKCRDLAKLKRRKCGYVQVELETLPKEVQKYLEVPVGMQMTPEEMVELIVQSKTERYVVLKDVSNMEDFFDVGVPYLGYLGDDKDYVKVYDRFGTVRECFVERVASMEPTERALELARRTV